MNPPRDNDGQSPQAPHARGARIPLGQRVVRFNRFYGRFVGGLKVLLPTLAVALVLLAIAWPMISEQDGRFVEVLTGADRRAAENLAVKNPRYAGIEDNGQPFTITAESMQQESIDSDFVDLVRPKADILLSNGNWVAVTAENGLLNRPTQVLELTDDVNLFHDLGYEFRTNQAVLDLAEGTASGNLPVSGQGPFGWLEGEGFRVLERGDRIALTGKSKVVIYPDQGGDS
ncbi:LPS export ABC transporter periplasmic protein LptC [Marivibrio halodurans]|uniref:LPS export ABC transporter periplasmic protein LptC n=1 Tax=Marivibrio halodurans TaxID=2039722 RepID=A0A8J7V386_9PROT|nr:LPS export ABC transporter periplasmic protein LptC [Marivibrio halodurans]MBP5857966.1 LPS export ABC transporter periplasmic protein LptC [Marivibrio halodurans]